MAAEDEIDLAPDVTAPPDWLNPSPTTTNEEPGALSDYGNAALAGVYNTGSALAGAADYIGRTVNEAAGKEFTDSPASEFREWAGEKGKEAVGRMSQRRQRAASAGWLPGASGGSIWDDDTSLIESLALKTTMSLPSLVASIVPGAIVARGLLAVGATAATAAASGTVAGAASGAAQSGGGVFDQIESEYRNMSDADLRKQVDMYDELRKRGVSEQEARNELVKYAVGAKPFIMAAITAGTSAFGVERLAAGLVGGTVRKGIARNIARGAIGEAAQETIESGAESAFSQQGQKGPKGEDINWLDVLDSAIQGGATGGVLGGAAGGVFGRGASATQRGKDDDEDTKPSDVASPPVGTDGAAEAPQPSGPPPSAPDGTPAVPLSGGEQTPPAASPATPSTSLEEDVDFADDELGDPSLTAALKVQPAEPGVAPTVDPDVTSTIAATSTPGSSPQDIADAIAQEVAAQQPVAPQQAQQPVQPEVTQQLPQQGNGAAAARVLQSETEAAQRAEAEWREAWARRGAEERARLRAEGDIPTQTRIRDTSAVSGEGIERMERRKWVAAAKRIADAQGDDTPVPVRQTVQVARQAEGMAPKDPRRVAINKRLDDLKQKAAEHYKGVAAERSAVAGSGFDTREATGAKVEGAGAKARQALKRRAERASDAAKDIVANTDSAPDEMLSDVNVRSKAVAARLDSIVKAAKEAGVAIPTRVTEETPLYHNVLKRYQDAARNIRSRRVPKGYDSFADYVADVQTDELMARKGKPEEVAERFRIEGDIRGGDDTQIADSYADTVEDEVASREEDEETETEASKKAIEPVRKPAPIERRREAEEDDGVAPVYGGTKKAPVVEVVKKRSVAPPNKPALPTPAQAAAGNYKKKKIYPFGLNVSVETAKGQMRSGVGSDGKPWSVQSPADYGYVRRTTGADGEQIDVYVGPYRDIRNAPVVYIVNQMDPATGKFDEHKALIGFKTEDEAIDAYVSGFSDDSGGSRIKSVEVMTVEEFRQWLKRPQQAETRSSTTILPSQDWTSVDTSIVREPVRIIEPITTVADMERAATKVTILGNALAAERIRAGSFSSDLTANITAPIAEAVRKTAYNVKTIYMDATDIMRMPWVATAINTGRISGAPGGFYDPDTDTIVMNNAVGRQGPEKMYRVLVHEGLHAALFNAIENAPTMRARLTDLYTTARDEYNRRFPAGSYFYGFTNEHEFISEAMTNPSFQDMLSGLQVPSRFLEGNVPQTFWQRFVDFARNVLSTFGGLRLYPVNNNALEAAMRVTADLFEVQGQVGRLGETGLTPMFSPIPGAVEDHARATAGWMRRTGYRFATLDYIRQMNKGLFVDKAGDALDKAVSVMQKITPYARDLRKDSERLAVEFINWGAKNPEQASAMSDLAIEATMLNVNLVDSTNPDDLAKANTHLGKDAVRGWQAKANLRQMQDRFMKLPPEARELWLAQAKYYRDTQNKVSRATISSLLEAVADKLTVQQREDLVNKTMAGTLDDADKVALGNNAVFNNLQQALVLRTIDGVYFPLMRYGNHVVTTRLKWGDMMGGKEVAHNQLEFRASKDSEARALARSYVQKTDIPVSSVKRVYYDRKTGQQLSAVDAIGHDVDVGYRVNVQRDGVFMFDSLSDAERFRREEGGEFAQMSGVMPKADYNQNNTLSAGQLSSLMSAVRNLPDDKVSAARKLEVEQALHQAAARMLPGNRVQKRTLKRKNVVGASADLSRALLTYGQASSGYLSRAKFMPELRDALARMRAVQADRTEISSQAVQRSLTLKEITDRVAGNVETVYEPNSFVQGLLTISFLDKLFSPAYSLLNAMQVQMTTYPYLAGKFGEAASAMQLARAYKAVGMGDITLDGIANTAKAVRQIKSAALDTRDIVGSIRERVAKESDGKQILQVFDELQSRGALDDGAVFELAQAVERGAGNTMTALSRVDRIARQLPFAIEQLNRTVSAIAAYRLATQQGKSHEAAMQQAFDTVMLTQFDYSSINSPLLFNNGLARIALQFKKYAANMAVLLYDMTQKAFRGTSLDERRAGRRQLANLVGMQMLTAGALSLPGLELIKVFGLLSGVLGLGGSYDDLERWLRQIAKEKLGEKPAEILLKGGSRMLGIDLSTRLSLADMFLFGEPKDYSQDGYQAYLFRLIAGAPGGYASDLMAATNNIMDGEVAKGVEKLIPIKLIADTQKAITKYRAGDFNLAEAGAQAFGLRPASAANQSDKIGDAIAKRKDQQAERKRLEKRYINASPAGRKELMGKIKEYNAGANWREKISFGALNRRIKAMDDKRAGRPNPDND